MPLQTTTEPEPEPAAKPEPMDPQEIIDFLDEALTNQPDNTENMEDMKAVLEEMLLEIENDYQTE